MDFSWGAGDLPLPRRFFCLRWPWRDSPDSLELDPLELVSLVLDSLEPDPLETARRDADF